MILHYLKNDYFLNSLYGRFGMDDNFANINIIHKDYLGDFENKFFDLIISKTELDEYILVETKTSYNIEDDESSHNVSIAVAAAITAYARIHMSQFKNNPSYNLYYTDSVYIDKPLPTDLINSKILGKMKLENILTDAIFLAPKLYCLETEDGEVIYKVKGLSQDIELTMNDFEQLPTPYSFKDFYYFKTIYVVIKCYVNR
jgi:hypothetical protein